MIIESIEWVPMVVMTTSVLNTFAAVGGGSSGSVGGSGGSVVAAIRLQLVVVRVQVGEHCSGIRNSDWINRRYRHGHRGCRC